MSRFIRALHRWLSIAVALGFITNAVVIFGLGQPNPDQWVYLLALVPLFLLLFSGLYLFALPYVMRVRRG